MKTVAFALALAGIAALQTPPARAETIDARTRANAIHLCHAITDRIERSTSPISIDLESSRATICRQAGLSTEEESAETLSLVVIFGSISLLAIIGGGVWLFERRRPKPSPARGRGTHASSSSYDGHYIPAFVGSVDAGSGCSAGDRGGSDGGGGGSCD